MKKLLCPIATGSLFICAAQAADVTVTAPQSIQAAVKSAMPGDTIRVMPGTYKETVYVDKDNLHLSGIIVDGQWPVLDGENFRNDGILVSGHSVKVDHFYVRRYLGNGIMTQGSNNFEVTYNKVEGPGFYGIFPQYGHNGLVAHNVVTAINGSAMYVGMSQNIDIVSNETHHNGGYGIEVENSSDVLIASNYTHDNTIGVVLNLIPGLPVKREERIVVRNNFIFSNGASAKPSADSPTVPVVNLGTGQPPEGTGILVNGADSSTIIGNHIQNNPGGGIIVFDLNYGQMYPVPDPKVDPFPDDDRIVDNIFTDNGAKPFGRMKEILASLDMTQGVDLLVAGRGRRDCISDKQSILARGADSWTACSAQPEPGSFLSMRLAQPVASPTLTVEQKGHLAWLAVCTGCHSFTARIYGPPMVAARIPYMGNPQKLADWIAQPTKKRSDYPAMPPQNYLPPEVRLEVAKYVLQDLKQ